jgi:predicted NBD/HSP70 family sugar kinase
VHSGPAPDIRRQNERRIVAHLLRESPLSRAELAQLTGLSQPTVGKVVADLSQRGIVAETHLEPAPGPRALGRPSRPLVLERSTRRFVTVHLGVRKTQLSALPVGGPVDERWQVEFPTPKRSATWVERLHRASERLGPVDCWGVAISTPGVCDEQAGRVLLSPNLHWTESTDLRALARRVWDVEVLIVQEIRALALGHLSAQPTTEDFLLVDFSTGVGGAMVRGSELYSGAVVLSGELGHTPIPGNARPCGCGAIGCVETLVSRPGLLESFSEHAGVERPAWSDLVAHVDEHGVEPWLAEPLDTAGTVVAGAMNVIGVVEAVVTGAITELPEPVFDRLGQAVERSSMWARFGQVKLHRAPRRRASGLVQAAIDRIVLPLEGRIRESA